MIYRLLFFLFPATILRLVKLSRYKNEHNKLRYQLTMLSNVQMDRTRLLRDCVLLSDTYNELKYFWMGKL